MTGQAGRGQAVEPDPEAVRAYMVRKGMRQADDCAPITPPEVRFFIAYKPLDDARDAREAKRRTEEAERWERAKAAMAAAQRHKEHMRRAREWGRANGYQVGTHGRIAAVVWAAYQRSIGEEL